MMTLPILDTHQHLWDLSLFRLPWLEGGGPLAKSHVLEDYAHATEGLNVVKTIYMEVDVDSSQRVGEAEYVLNLCRQPDTRMAGAVIGGDPSQPGFSEYLDHFRGDSHLKGVRQVLHGGQPQGYCLRDSFIEGCHELGRRGLRFDICIPSDHLRDAARLAESCPETPFILDHCGNAPVQTEDRSVWEEGLAEVARQPNVVCKISGIVASAAPGTWTPDDLAPIILRCAEAFGHNRIMFASDWPVCTLTATYRQWVDALSEIVAAWSEEDQRKLFHDNAARFYGVD